MQIRCRPNKEGSNAGIHNTLCEKFQSGVKCSDSPVCPFPHNHLEMQLWELESSGAFNIQSFIKETGEKGICTFKENLYILIEQVDCCNIISLRLKIRRLNNLSYCLAKIYHLIVPNVLKTLYKEILLSDISLDFLNIFSAQRNFLFPIKHLSK